MAGKLEESGHGPWHQNIWVVSVNMDQNLTACLPGKGLVPWVVPMTHLARTAHPRLRVVSKQRLTGQCPVVRVMTVRWMGLVHVFARGWASRKRDLRDNAGTRGDEAAGWQFGFCSQARSEKAIVQEFPFCFCQSLCHQLLNWATWIVVPFICTDRYALCNC